jgi:cyclophilin family peptidyl-prolyl cis-trans isomerase
MLVRLATAGFVAVLLWPGLSRVGHAETEPAEPAPGETASADAQPESAAPRASESQSPIPDRSTVAAAQAEFDANYAEFKKRVGKLRTLTGKFRLAKSVEQPKINGEFDQLVAETKSIANRLTASAEALYRVDPKNQDVADLMFMMLSEAVETEHYQRAAPIAQLLLGGEYADKRLFGLAAVAAYCTNDFAQANLLLQKAIRADAVDQTVVKELKNSADYEVLWETEKKLRDAEQQADDLPRVKLATTKGDIVVELFENEAPNTTANFISLVEKKFYDGLLFHRVVSRFVAQAGDPQGNSKGGPGYTIACECFEPNHRQHFSGSLSMAHTGERDTGGSQFFLTLAPTPHLNGKHTVFGRIVEGFDALADLNRTEPRRTGPPDKIIQATVLRKRDHKYEPVTQPAAQP